MYLNNLYCLGSLARIIVWGCYPHPACAVNAEACVCARKGYRKGVRKGVHKGYRKGVRKGVRDGGRGMYKLLSAAACPIAKRRKKGSATRRRGVARNIYKMILASDPKQWISL